VTIEKLIKLLQMNGEIYGMKTQVCADTKALRDTCNDVWAIVNVSSASVEYIEQCDGDGFTKFKKDGSQAERKCLVLR
jgi:hypothetical protein